RPTSATDPGTPRSAGLWSPRASGRSDRRDSRCERSGAVATRSRPDRRPRRRLPPSRPPLRVIMPPVAQPHPGRWFEDLAPGTGGAQGVRRTVTETDNVVFTTMTMNAAPLHLDYEYAARTEFGRPIVNSMFTVAVVVGITALDLTHGTTVANLGFDEI